jgi:hypothetical protein
LAGEFFGLVILLHGWCGDGHFASPLTLRAMRCANWHGGVART